jgi:hypothetical protein
MLDTLINIPVPSWWPTATTVRINATSGAVDAAVELVELLPEGVSVGLIENISLPRLFPWTAIASVVQLS